MLIGNPKFEWRRAPRGMKLLGLLCAVAWGAVAASMLINGWVEAAARSQPMTPDALYAHCYKIKGMMRCLTDHQALLFVVGRYAYLPAMLAVACVWGLYAKLSWRY